MTRHQNVLFILIDQLRADLLNGELAKHVDLPNLHALMADAVTFQRHFSVTNPCGPSRASILTGQYAMNHRSVRNGTPLRHDTPNLASEARKCGYQPLLFGLSMVLLVVFMPNGIGGLIDRYIVTRKFVEARAEARRGAA